MSSNGKVTTLPSVFNQDAASSPNMQVDTIDANWYEFGVDGTPQIKNSSYQINTENSTQKTNTQNAGGMFSSGNIGGTLQGIGAIGGALASIYGISEQKKFNEDMLDMEKDRVAKEYAKRDKQQSEYDSVWKS
ncbi:hypothetical protein [Malaciobacter mytili]|uniref:hypothetical protein n=1 Tax=Malaciobacter mytili TaxID=603050 RepID=UPI003A85DA20